MSEKEMLKETGRTIIAIGICFILGSIFLIAMIASIEAKNNLLEDCSSNVKCLSYE